MIDLHYSATPNGQKIAIMIEEIGEPYRVIPYDIFEGDQLSGAFGRINPNHKLPAIVDQAPAGQDYAVDRYTKELKRLLTVLEKRLEKNAYVAGDDYTIADMAIWPGRASAFVMGMGLDEWPAMHGWFERIRARPAVVRAMAREDLKAPAKYIGRHQKLDDKEWSNMFGAANHAAVAKD